VCRYSWRVPPKFSGKVKVEVDANFGPFELKDEEAWHPIEAGGISNIRGTPAIPAGETLDSDIIAMVDTAAVVGILLLTAILVSGRVGRRRSQHS
jgi:hypothetical protein